MVCRILSLRLLAAGKANLEKISLVRDRAQIPGSASLWRSKPETFDQNCTCFSKAGKTTSVLSSNYEMKHHRRKKDTTQQKKMKNMTITARRSAGLTQAEPALHAEPTRSRLFSLYISVLDLASTAQLNTFGNHNVRTQQSKELRLTLFQK